MSLRPRIAAACRRAIDRVAVPARPLGFELRLARGAGTHARRRARPRLRRSPRHVLRDELIDRDAQHHAADARALEAAVHVGRRRGARPGRGRPDARTSSRAARASSASRSWTATASSSRTRGTVGSSSQPARRRAAHGTATRASSNDETRRCGNELEFAAPLVLDGQPLRARGRRRTAPRSTASCAPCATRWRSSAAAGLPFGFLLFHVFGGHALTRRHRQRDPARDARSADRPAQPPRVPGGAAARLLLRRPPRRAVRARARRSRRLQVHQRPHGHRHGDEVLLGARARALLRPRGGPGLPDRRRRVRRAVPGTDGAGAQDGAGPHAGRRAGGHARRRRSPPASPCPPTRRRTTPP